MNKQAQIRFTFGFALVLVVFVLTLVLFSLIDPFKETLDDARDGNSLNTGLNCPNTPNFDLNDYENDTDFERLVRRPTCFVTGISMVYFIFAFLISSVIWAAVNWGKLK